MPDQDDTIYYREVYLEEYFLHLANHQVLFDLFSDQLIVLLFQNHLLHYLIDG